MPLRKLSEQERPCPNREHNPPSMIVLSPGTYEYTCPGCGSKMVFTVSRPTL